MISDTIYKVKGKPGNKGVLKATKLTAKTKPEPYPKSKALEGRVKVSSLSKTLNIRH
jgi:hypothetical protein